MIGVLRIMERTVEHFDLEDMEREYYGDLPRPISLVHVSSLRRSVSRTETRLPIV